MTYRHLVVLFFIVAAQSFAEERKPSKKDSFPFPSDEELLSSLSSSERSYTLARIALGGSLPKLDANDLINMKSGSIGELVRNGSDYSFSLDQVVSDNEFLMYGSNIWVEGISTDDLIDDANVSTKGVVFEVKGTKRYTTALGTSRTVRLLTVVDTSKADKVVDQILENSLYWMWYDKSGKFKVLAKYLKYERGEVHLRRANGKLLQVPLMKLSAKDQAWVRAEVKRRKAMEGIEAGLRRQMERGRRE